MRVLCAPVSVDLDRTQLQANRKKVLLKEKRKDRKTDRQTDKQTDRLRGTHMISLILYSLFITHTHTQENVKNVAYPLPLLPTP